MLIFSKSQHSFSLADFQSNLNAKLSFSTVSAYVTALCFIIYSQRCFSICYSTVFQHLIQHCVSASVTALCFSICYSTVFQHLLQHCVSASVTALCFSICYSTVFQHMLQHCVSAYTHSGVSAYDSALCFSI
jgi:hypothetical protein